MVFPWSFNACKPPQVSRTHLSILADLNYAAVWMVSTRLVISASSNPCTTSTNYNGYNRHFHVPPFFFKSLARSRYWSFFSLSFTQWSAKFTILQVLPFLLIIMRSGRLAEIRWYVCMSKSQRGLCVSFFRTDVGWCTYDLFVWSNLNFLHSSQQTTLPPSRVKFYIPFVIICYIRLLRDWYFYLYPHITYICYFVFNWNHFEMRLLNLRINLFYLLLTFVFILVVFVLFLLSPRFGQISLLAFFRWFTATSDRNAESWNRIPSNYCLP